MDTTLVFEVLDRLVEALTAHTEPGGVLEKVAVEDAWPAGRINSRDTVIVADADGSEVPATLRAGGGTRDDTFRVEVAVAAVRKTANAKVVRDRAKELQAAVERVALNEIRQTVPRVYRSRVIEYNVRQFVHDKGRECDVIMRVECKARLLPTGAA